MSSKSLLWRLVRAPLPIFLILIALFTVLGLSMVDFRSIDSSSKHPIRNRTLGISRKGDFIANTTSSELSEPGKTCATVEEMGEIFNRGYTEESLRARRIIHNHFVLNGASRIRELHPHEFCNHSFVIGKASEAGLGNELYKILTAGALSVMLNRSLIIGQTRGRSPFGDYISYSNISFTLNEVKQLWRQNQCLTKYGRPLIMRIDDFQKPAKTGVLCSNWKEWEQAIIWFQNTTDATAAQFFLKNVHSEMRNAAFDLFGSPENLQYRANVFGELMRILMSPSSNVEHAVNWALNGGRDPDIALHMRMMMDMSVRAKRAALDCVRKAVHNNLPMISKPKVVVVSDTPSMVKDITSSLEEFAEVLHFDYENFDRNSLGNKDEAQNMSFRVKDWGPAPRWVAFVDFFLASRAKHVVISGALRRVGTTYAQLIAALAAANTLEEKVVSNTSITFLSSFQSSMLNEGLKSQIGWGHVWNRFAGPLSCQGQMSQCALTPVLPPAWWDGLWQSPIERDAQKMELYGVNISGFGTIDEGVLKDFCRLRKSKVVGVQLI